MGRVNLVVRLLAGGVKMLLRTCVICGKTFKVLRADSPIETCSRRCGSINSRRHRDTPPPEAYRPAIEDRVERFAMWASKEKPLFAERTAR